MVSHLLRAALCSLLFVSAPLAAQDGASAADGAADIDPAAAFMAALKPQRGAIDLPGGKARLNLPDDLYYLSPEDTRNLVVNGWGNPPESAVSVLGMIVPSAVNPLTQEGWGVVITYSDDGHISDEDADQMDYTALLKQMQEGEAEENAARKQAGYEPIRLVGWAEPPRYDRATHKMYWAKDLAFGSDASTPHTLNYAIRVLGREGVLELNAVASMSQLADMRREMQQIVAVTEFTAGHRYADFNASTDKLAGYGIAGLIAGTLAAKKGLFAVIGLFLVKFWKLIAIGGVALVAGLGKLFGGKNKTA